MTAGLRTVSVLFISFATFGMANGGEHDSDVPKTIQELQQFRQTSSIHIKSHEGKDGIATLINLNPGVNAWFLLEFGWNDGSELAFHLENPEPRTRKLLLDEKHPMGIAIAEGKNRFYCDLFEGDALGQARASQHIFAPLCEGRVYLRNAAKGHRTNLEATTEFLREHVWGGESIIGLGHILLGDMQRETGKIEAESPGAGGAEREARTIARLRRTSTRNTPIG